MDERTDWPDPRLDRLEARINGIPEKVALLAQQVADLVEDVHAIRRVAEKESQARETNKTGRVVAVITASGAILAAVISSVTLMVTQL